MREIKVDEDIKHIQNALWAMYKEFLADHSVREWTLKGEALVHEYAGKKIRSFCENQLITWTPVINGLAEEFRDGKGKTAEKLKNAGG